MSNEEFLKQLNDKKNSAFKELYECFYHEMLLLARHKVLDLDVAEDIVQEVYISIWESPKQYNSFYGFRAYLVNSVINRCFDVLKHKQVFESYVAYVQSHGKDFEEEYDLEQESLFQNLYLALEKLPLRCRFVFEMHLENKKNEEIAKALSITINTVKNHKKNAYSFLKQYFKSNGNK